MLRVDKKLVSMAEEVAEYVRLSVRNRCGEQVKISDLSKDGFILKNSNGEFLGRACFFDDGRRRPIMIKQKDHNPVYYDNDPTGVMRLQEDLISLALNDSQMKRVS